MEKESILETLLKTISKAKTDSYTNFKSNNGYHASYRETKQFLQNLPARLNHTHEVSTRVLNLTEPKSLSDTLDSIFTRVATHLPVSEHSLSIENFENSTFIAPVLETYKRKHDLCDKTISIYDSLFVSNSEYRKALFHKYKDKIQLLILNVYRITTVFDVIVLLNPNMTMDEAIFSAIKLTASFSGEMSLPSHIVSFGTFLDQLLKPPDWPFISNLMNSLKLSYFVERNNNEEVRLYNENYFNDKCYILFEFQNFDNVFLKCVFIKP
ncbi:DhNV_036 [Dikerogammarus haemobaphes nudivirus]|nr:DhNV_036 [Dikerogammarus haemobaphes nudivirus]